MSLSSPFIRRPVATALLMVAIVLLGGVAYSLLPVAALPNVSFPTIAVTAQLPGADPQTMASSVATPLEKQFGQIPYLTQMTSTSSTGYTQITLQFALNDDIKPRHSWCRPRSTPRRVSFRRTCRRRRPITRPIRRTRRSWCSG